MKFNGMFWAAYAAVWMSTATAVSVGIYYTQSANCLWAMLIPTFVSLSSRPTGDSK